jgi:hypothetical protein
MKRGNGRQESYASYAGPALFNASYAGPAWGETNHRFSKKIGAHLSPKFGDHFLIFSNFLDPM